MLAPHNPEREAEESPVFQRGWLRLLRESLSNPPFENAAALRRTKVLLYLPVSVQFEVGSEMGKARSTGPCNIVSAGFTCFISSFGGLGMSDGS
jgi:hypothetical protein